jgi:hypothetical protein
MAQESHAMATQTHNPKAVTFANGQMHYRAGLIAMAWCYLGSLSVLRSSLPALSQPIGTVGEMLFCIRYPGL